MKTYNKIAGFKGIQSETAKAIKAHVDVFSPNGHRTIEGERWFPKSLVKIQDDELYVESWFVNKTVVGDTLSNKWTFDAEGGMDNTFEL